MNKSKSLSPNQASNKDKLALLTSSMMFSDPDGRNALKFETGYRPLIDTGIRYAIFDALFANYLTSVAI